MLNTLNALVETVLMLDLECNLSFRMPRAEMPACFKCSDLSLVVWRMWEGSTPLLQFTYTCNMHSPYPISKKEPKQWRVSSHYIEEA